MSGDAAFAPRLLIRADADEVIGTGHVMRCLALAHAWTSETGGSVEFASVGSLPPMLLERIEAARADWRALGAPSPGGADDLRAFLSLAREVRPRCVVVDCYAVDEPYQRGLARAGVPFLMLDDHRNQRAFLATWVLNQNLQATEAFYAGVRGEPEYLLGPRYGLLRSEFVSPGPPLRDPTRPVRELLITPGGSDPHGVTAMSVAAVAKLGDLALHTTAVIGPAVGNPEAVESELRKMLPPARLTVVREVRDMYALMARADVAITAAGSTTIETMYMGLASLLVLVADNQAGQGEAAERAGLACLLGAAPDLTPERIAVELSALLRDPERRAGYVTRSQRVCDGHGARRVVEVMLRGAASS